MDQPHFRSQWLRQRDRRLLRDSKHDDCCTQRHPYGGRSDLYGQPGCPNLYLCHLTYQQLRFRDCRHGISQCDLFFGLCVDGSE
jgi:hypothetical protein